MRKATYLNVILTANAVLLGGLLWTHVAETPILAQSASAQVRTSTPPALKPGTGVPNAGMQRDAMIRALQDIQRSVESTRKLLESGGVTVEVSNLDQYATSVDR